jgi:nucleoside-diphosphate-sugar epimerase
MHVVFGANGPTGRAVIDELVRLDLPARAVSRSQPAGLPTGVEAVAADATDREAATRAAAGATVVYHCIGAPYTDWPERLPRIMDGLIGAAATAKAKLVYADNLYAYGPTDVPLTESRRNAATGTKGRLRALLANQLLEAHRQGLLRAAIGRASDFYGPRVRLSHLGERVFDAALDERPASILANPAMPHTYTFIRDFASALVTLATDERADGEVWHVPNAETGTTGAFIQEVYRQADTTPKLRPVPPLVVHLLGLFNPMMRELRETLYQVRRPWVVDHTKFDRAFGARPTAHADGIADTLEFFRTERETPQGRLP